MCFFLKQALLHGVLSLEAQPSSQQGWRQLSRESDCGEALLFDGGAHYNQPTKVLILSSIESNRRGKPQPESNKNETS